MPSGLSREFRLPYGAGRRIARKRRVAETFVSGIVHGRLQPQTERVIRKAALVKADIAALFSVPVEVAFPESLPPGAAPEVGAADAAFSAVA